jgi:glycosyltransferase involved in cell wall biosynthesis
MKKVSCIICAYNEGPRIGNILKVVMNNSLLDEIIVVNDGSVDNTEKEALKFKGIKFIGHEKNLGKSSSMLDGLNNAKNDIVMFLDADLIDLTSDNITQLIKPVIEDSIDMTMAMCNYDFVLNTFSKLFGVEVPNGQRAIKKEIAKEILKNAIGYSVELQMNQYILENNLKFLVVNWCNVKAPLKRKKDGIKKGFIGTIIGFKQLATKVPLTQIIKQMLIMGKLSNRYKKELNIK